MKPNPYLIAGLALAFAPCAGAAIVINELFLNPPGTDQGLEYIELRSTTGGVESLNGLTLIVIEGDGVAGTSPAGIIDQVLSLEGFSTGTNGLFLWRDANSIAFVPAADAATTQRILDFAPDLENGSNTFLLVSGFTGVLGTDYDITPGDGVLDSTPWTSVVDGVGFLENDGTANTSYAGAAGFYTHPANPDFNADVLFRAASGEWVGSDVIADGLGAFQFDPERNFVEGGAGALPGDSGVTPGSANVALVPEPGTLGLLGGVLALGAFRRRRTA